jgi:hypothetical protein
MPAHSRVPGGVAVRRAIAAQCRAALLTRPQMNPLCADLHTLIALPSFRVFDRSDRVEMRTTYISHHHVPFIHAVLDGRRQLQWTLRRLPTPHA